MAKKKIKPSEEEEYKKLEYDENNNLVIKEIVDPNFDMRYFEYNEKDVKMVEKIIRSSFEYRELIYFMKTNLDVNRCSYYENYSMKNGLTIELHHSPFTLFNITEAVIARFMHEKGCWETFRVAEEVIKLHYQFKVGLTPLNPTAHKLVHSQVLPVHPKIVLGFWKEFYGEYAAYLSAEAIKNYEDAIKMEKEVKSVKLPKIMEYAPTPIISPMQQLTSDLVNKICIESRLKALESM